MTEGITASAAVIATDMAAEGTTSSFCDILNNHWAGTNNFFSNATLAMLAIVSFVLLLAPRSIYNIILAISGVVCGIIMGSLFDYNPGFGSQHIQTLDNSLHGAVGSYGGVAASAIINTAITTTTTTTTTGLPQVEQYVIFRQLRFCEVIDEPGFPNYVARYTVVGVFGAALFLRKRIAFAAPVLASVPVTMIYLMLRILAPLRHLTIYFGWIFAFIAAYFVGLLHAFPSDAADIVAPVAGAIGLFFCADVLVDTGFARMIHGLIPPESPAFHYVSYMLNEAKREFRNPISKIKSIYTTINSNGGIDNAKKGGTLGAANSSTGEALVLKLPEDNYPSTLLLLFGSVLLVILSIVVRKSMKGLARKVVRSKRRARSQRRR